MRDQRRKRAEEAACEYAAAEQWCGAGANSAVETAVEIIEHGESKPRRIPSRSWRELIKKVWEVDPLCHRGVHSIRAQRGRYRRLSLLGGVLCRWTVVARGHQRGQQILPPCNLLFRPPSRESN